MASLDDIKIEPLVDSEIENADDIFSNALQQLAASTSADNGGAFSQEDIDALDNIDLDALMNADLGTEEPPSELDMINNLFTANVSDVPLHVKEEPPDIQQLLQKLDSEIGVSSSDATKTTTSSPVISFCPSLSSEHVEGLASTAGGGMFSSDEDEPLTPSISQTVAALGLPTTSSSSSLWPAPDDNPSLDSQSAMRKDGDNQTMAIAPSVAISDASVCSMTIVSSVTPVSNSASTVQSNICNTSSLQSSSSSTSIVRSIMSSTASISSSSTSTTVVTEAPSQGSSQGQFSAALEQLVLNAAAPKTTTRPSWASMPLPLYSGSEAGPDTQVTPSNQSSHSASTKPESLKKVRDGKLGKKRKSDTASNKHDASLTSPAKTSKTVSKSSSPVDSSTHASNLKLTIRLSQHGKLGEVINHQGKTKHRKDSSSEHRKHSSDKSKKSKSSVVAATKTSSGQKSGVVGQRTTIEIAALPQPSSSGEGGAQPSASANAFSVDTTRIHAVPTSQQDSELQNLGLTVYNAAEFEEGVMAQVDEALAAEEKERRDRIIKKEIKGVQDDLRTTKQELSHIDKVLSMMSPQVIKGDKESKQKMESVRRQKENKIKQLKKLRAKQKMLTGKLHGSAEGQDDEDSANLDAEDAASSAMLDAALGRTGSGGETDAERAIRLGEMTPFGTVMSFPETSSKPKKVPPPPPPKASVKLGASDFDKYLMDQANKASLKKKQFKKTSSAPDLGEKSISKDSRPNGASHSSHKDKLFKVTSDPEMQSDKHNKSKGQNRFDAKDKRHWYRDESDMSRLAAKRRRIPHARLNHNFTGDRRLDEYGSDDDYYHGDEEYMPHPDEMIGEDEDFSDATIPVPKKKRKSSGAKKRPHVSASGDPEWSDSGASSGEDIGAIKSQFKVKVRQGGRDDGSLAQYVQRVKKWKKSRLKEKQKRINNGEAVSDSSDDEAEFDGGFRVPGRIWKNLYMYQKTGVKWLWELHGQQTGGIVGDEMGLGKTIQIISFLAGLRVSKLRDRASKYSGLGPTIIVCPATVMHQWVREFHKWWPPFRVAVLHSSGSYNTSEADLIYDIVTSNGVLIMSYQSLVAHQDTLLEHEWHYIILDEGHKIRNPDAQVTLAAKQFRSCHRLILSGSPVQNNLKELWSLFDFVFPGKLGTLPDFMQHFSVPIVQGGYSTASQVQVTTAYKCACILRDTINPYLLRRMKSDVQCNINLPDKNEQVLFCRLTEEQRDIYEEYLDSKECSMIVQGRFMVFPGLITLRKICNHPDLSTGGPQDFSGGDLVGYSEEEKEYGWFKRSGKMIVVESLLKLWNKQGHRVLLFSQSKQMLYILENFVMQQNYSYLRMDGGTSISARQPLINRFNEDTSLFIFLLTTHVGGLGVNLTGADRIIIFDPDWNPSTDCQARERAWRIGQTKQVTIYRLLTAGTIEEKIYHRQIFKQFLTNRVLKDPKQRRFFKANDLYELFTLGNDNPESSTETSAIFAGTGSDVTVRPGSFKPRSRKKHGSNRFDELKERQAKEKEKDAQDQEEEEEEAKLLGLAADKLVELREMAKSLSVKVTSKGKSDASTRTAKSDTNKTAEKYQIPKTKETEREVSSPETGKTVVTDTQTESNCIEIKEEGKSPISAPSNDAATSQSDNTENPESLVESKESHLRELARKLSEKIVSEEGSQDSVSKSKSNSSVSPDAASEPVPSTSQNADVRSESKSHSHRHKKHKKHKKHKRRHGKDAVFEGEKIANLAKVTDYRPGDKDAVKTEEENKREDDYVLKRLFKKTGVHSAMQHDRIMQSSDPDYALVEGEAERVAKEAARALKESRARCQSATAGVPTWTGQSGVSGAPQESKPRFGRKKNSKLLPASSAAPAAPSTSKATKRPEPSEKARHFDGTVAGVMKAGASCSEASTPNMMTSSELLSKMRARNHLLNAASGEDGAAGPSSHITEQEVDLMADIRNHIAFACSVDGQASTQELLDHFSKVIPSGESAKFKAMLKQLCTFSKRSGIGIWKLRQDFR